MRPKGLGQIQSHLVFEVYADLRVITEHPATGMKVNAKIDLRDNLLIQDIGDAGGKRALFAPGKTPVQVPSVRKGPAVGQKAIDIHQRHDDQRSPEKFQPLIKLLQKFFGSDYAVDFVAM